MANLPYALNDRSIPEISSVRLTAFGRKATDLLPKASHPLLGPVMIRSGLTVCPSAAVPE